jgi:hypothetical protein
MSNSRSRLKVIAAGAAVGVAGLFTFVYSALNGLALLGLDFSSGMRADLLAIYPLLAFPTYLLVFVSPRWASAALWIFFILQWARCYAISWPVPCHNPIDSFAGKILLAAVVLVNMSWVLSHSSQRSDKASVSE